MQPENPAELGGKIYEMMGSALLGKWSVKSETRDPVTEPRAPEILEAEVVEPVEAGSQK